MKTCLNSGHIYSFSSLLLGGKWEEKKKAREKSIATHGFGITTSCICVIVITYYLAWFWAHSYTGKSIWLLDVSLFVWRSSCWWPSSYQVSGGGKFWGSESWWLLNLPLQILEQKFSGVVNSSHPCRCINRGWTEFIDLNKRLLWNSSLWSLQTSLKWEKLHWSHYVLRGLAGGMSFPLAARACVVAFEAHLRNDSPHP